MLCCDPNYIFNKKKFQATKYSSAFKNTSAKQTAKLNNLNIKTIKYLYLLYFQNAYFWYCVFENKHQVY